MMGSQDTLAIKLLESRDSGVTSLVASRADGRVARRMLALRHCLRWVSRSPRSGGVRCGG